MGAVRRHGIRLIGIALALGTAASMVYRGARLPSEAYLGMSELGAEVALVIPGGPAERAGIRSGDHILAIGGRPTAELTNPPALLRAGGPDRSIFLTLERDRQERVVELLPEGLPDPEIHWLRAHALIALATLLVGTIALVRKGGLLTSVFYGICLALAILIFRPFVAPNALGFRLDAIRGLLLSTLLPGLLVHFFLLFPYERPVLARRPWLHGILYLPGTILFLLALPRASFFESLGIDPRIAGIAIETGAGVTGLAALVLSVTLFARAYRSSPLPTVRRKLTITLTGTLLGLLPLLLVLTARTAHPGLHIPADRTATLMVFFLPASFGYAILRHGIFDIEFIVKRSLVYSGMTAALVLSYFGLYFVLHAILHNMTGIDERLGSLLAVVFVLLLISPFRHHLQQRLDRWVYPDRYEVGRAVREASTALREAAGPAGVEQALLRSVRLLLGVRTAAVFRPGIENGYYSLCARLSPHGAEPAAAVPNLRMGRLLADPLFACRGPVLREELEAELPYGFLPRQDLEALEACEARVLVPLASGQKRLGIAVLGRRRFGEPYTAPDLELLEGLQAQAALAMENALFTREQEGHADLQREMEVARSIQAQLLPQELPRLPALEIAASNVPCREIGGDYYDWLRTGPEQLVVAIGDVSGKGVPAALLMANVQATFRAEAAAGRSPRDVLDRMNRRLCAIDRPERFVSFFCGRVELERRSFAYANAGHFQPMLVRADGSNERLDRGGLLLGIHEEAPYEGGDVPLAPGDVLVLFTDGVIERGGAESPFGEPELLATAVRHRHLAAPDILGRIQEELQDRCGAAVEDDTTLMVMKML